MVVKKTVDQLALEFAQKQIDKLVQAEKQKLESKKKSTSKKK